MDIELDLLEALALSEDRPAAIDALLPGTTLHDYYRGVLLQHQGKLDEVDAILASWQARHPDDDGPYQSLRRRQLLLRAGADLATHTDTIRFEAGLTFDDQAEAEVAAQRYPTRLDPALIEPSALTGDALRRSSDLSYFTDWSLPGLVAKGGSLGLSRIRELLRRLTRAGIPGVLELIARELGDSASSGFGSLAIQRLLTLDQLFTLLKLRPQLRQDGAWVQAVLNRTRPSAQVDITVDLGARRAYLDALSAFVEPLPAGFNSLKVQVLYHQLDLDRRLGAFDRARFLRYLELPRAQSYVDSGWLRGFPSDQIIRPGQGSVSAPLLDGVSSDEELVSDHLQYFLAREEMDAFADRLRRDWLIGELAKARLLAGDPDTRRWTGMLSESALAALRERVDITLSPRNPVSFGAGDAVKIELLVKNVPELVVKVFRINALAYFLARGAEVDTSVDLDGMVASDERTLTLDAPAIQQTRLSIDLPGCARPGTYVVELIGNGKASRALIRKGTLRFSTRIGAAGVTVSVFDEGGRFLPDARLWMGGREYLPREDGEISLPFSTQPGYAPILLVHGDLAQRETLENPAETFSLSAAFQVERQALVAGKSARILLRPSLSVASTRAPIALLEEPRVEITVVDLLGVASTRIEPVVLRDDAECAVDIRVPEDASRIALRLRGRVRVMSTQQTLDLDDGDGADINVVHTSDQTEVMHLATTAEGHVLHLLGKSGEPRPGRAVSLTIKHVAVSFELSVTLSTDERGRIELGPLPGVERVSVGAETWWIWPDVAGPTALGAVAGEAITLAAPPFLDEGEIPLALSLTEQRFGLAVRDLGERLSLDGRTLRIAGLEPGQYLLSGRGLPSAITLEIAPAPVDRARGWSFAGPRMIELSPPQPILRTLRADEHELCAEIVGAGPETRVHLVAVYFRPSSVLARSLLQPSPSPRTSSAQPVLSSYVSGRDIGDEYRYILARRTAPRRPGMLLEKPSLLLNPWALRATESGLQVAASGDNFRASGPRAGAAMPAPKPARGGQGGQQGTLASFDFLAAPAVVLANLRPDAQGKVRVPLADLGQAQLVRVLVIDPARSSSADLALPETAPTLRDRRLRLALDPHGHFAEERRIEALPAGATIVVDDVRTGKLELVDTLARAHQVLLTLGDDDALRELGFLTQWPSLPAAEQQRLYSKYACHELNLFLSQKDPPFFARVIRPTLASKLHPTFVDRYLLDEDLRAYLDPWAFGRLNTLEQILLARRVPELRASIARLVGDAVDRIPPDPEQDARLVDTLLGAAGLEEGGIGGAASAAAELAMPEPIEMETRSMPAKSMLKRKGRPSDESMDAMLSDDGFPPPPGAAPAPQASYGPPPAMAPAPLAGFGGGGRMERDMADLRERSKADALYRSADKTQEWAETAYWKKRIEEINADLLTPSRFLRDLALHREGPFLSPHLGDCAVSFTAAFTALTFLDLPFTAAQHELTIDETRLSLTAKSHALAARTRIAAIAEPESRGPILVGQSYLRADDPVRWEGAEQREKYVTGELLTGVVYQCRIAVTNPTSAAQRLDLLLQIPRGAVPVQSGFLTRTRHLHLGPYGTEALTYSFYFPAQGSFTHFPAHVSHEGALAAFAEPTTLEVVREPTVADAGSWAHVSQQGSLDEVLSFLDRENLGRIDLGRVAWRMRDREAFTRVTDLLDARHVYHDRLWAYALAHADRRRAAEWLRHQDGFLDLAGPALDGGLVALDPVERGRYQHLEYAPLINARAHQLGKRRRILNDALAGQYRAFLDLLAHRAKPSDDELLAAAHYAFCLDRTDWALSLLDRVRPEGITARLQYDYLAAYAACCRGDLRAARALIAPWLDHPVDRHRFRAAALAAMLDEAEGRAPGAGRDTTGAVDPDSRDQAMADLAARQPTLDLVVEKGQLFLQQRNLNSVRLRFYRMDLELLFSRQPFVQGDVERFSWIDPGEVLDLPLAAPGRTPVPIPEALQGANLVVSADAAGLRRSIAHYAHDLAVELAHHYGQVRVLRASTQAPLPAAYVKVYARQSGGAVAFYKDGYTDLRGRFDYATLSTDDLDRVERFALLVVSTEAGGAVLEAPPPAR